jgi:O-antigen ligase
MTVVARLGLGLVFIAALAWYGGAGDFTRPLLAVAVAVVLLLTALGLRSRLQAPPLAWIALLFAPLVAVTLLHVLPLGWHHPWVEPDLAALQVEARAWSIDPPASGAALAWLVTLAGIAVAVTVLGRGERARALAEVLVGVAALTALLGLCLSLADVPWPSAARTSSVRGPFIYPNHAAAFWAACLPLATLLAHRRPDALRWGAVAVLALAVLLSGSRGGILVAAAVMLPLAVHLLPRRRRWWWAAGGALAVAGWLWVIGLGEVADKFARLRGAEGLTLNGRVVIWQAALPVIADAGALGAGAGTTIPAFRRSGETHFADLLVNHLHSDPLEWWLEYGWFGSLVLLAALAAAAWRLRPQPAAWADPARRMLLTGAGAGLLALMLHGCGDFIWHNTVVATTGVVLLCLAAVAGQAKETAPRPRRPVQAVCLGLAVLVAGAGWWSWSWHASEVLARDVERAAVARRAAGLPLGQADAVVRAAQAVPGSVRLATTQAWLALAAGDRHHAEARLAAAAQLAPGDAGTWVQRALLASSAGDVAGAATAVRHALRWAPAWPDVHQVALTLAAQGGGEALPVEQVATLVTSVLDSDRPQPPWFFPLAARTLGEEALLRHLARAGEGLRTSAEPWLAAHAPLPDWLALRPRPASPRVGAAAALLGDRLWQPGTWSVTVPVDIEDRRALAEAVDAAGLPLPMALSDALRRDGPPWASWAVSLDLLVPATRAELALVLRTHLHRPWARAWADRVTLAERALAGDLGVVTRDLAAPVLACLAGRHPRHAPPPGLSSVVGERAGLLLQRWRDWEWQDLPHGAGRWSWWYGDGTGQALIDLTRWTALVIDGTWIGWVRGRQDLGPLLGLGLRQVVLLVP